MSSGKKTPPHSFTKLAGVTGSEKYTELKMGIIFNYAMSIVEVIREVSGAETVAQQQLINKMIGTHIKTYLKYHGASSAEIEEQLRAIDRILKAENPLVSPTLKEGGGPPSLLTSAVRRAQNLQKHGENRNNAIINAASEETGVPRAKVQSLLARILKMRGGGKTLKRGGGGPSLRSIMTALLAALGAPGTKAQPPPSPSYAPLTQYVGPGRGEVQSYIPPIGKIQPSLLKKTGLTELAGDALGSAMRVFSPAEGRVTESKTLQKAANARRAADIAMAAQPATRGVIPWIQSQSLEAILKYVQHPLYKITRSKERPADADEYVPVQQARDQLALLGNNMHYLGDVIIETTTNYYSSEDMGEFFGYTGLEGSVKPPTGLWMSIVRSSSAEEVREGIAIRASLRDEEKELIKSGEEVSASISKMTVALANKVHAGPREAAARKQVMQSLGLPEVADFITGIVSQRITGGVSSMFHSVTPTEGNNARESIYATPESPISVEYSSEIDDIMRETIRQGEINAALLAKRAEIKSATDKPIQEREVVGKVYVPASQFNIELKGVMGKYLTADGEHLSTAITSMPDFKFDIYHVGLYKPSQMPSTVAPATMIQTLETRKRWGEQEWIAMAETFSELFEAHVKQAQKLNLTAVEEARNASLISVQEAKGLVEFNRDGASILAGVKGAVQALVGAGGKETFKQVAQAYITDITVSPGDIKNEAESAMIQTIVNEAAERGTKLAEFLDETATDVLMTGANFATFASKGARFVSANLVTIGIAFVLDLNIMGGSFGGTPTLPKLTDKIMASFKRTGVTTIGAGALGVVGWIYGGPIGAFILSKIAGAIGVAAGAMNVDLLFFLLTNLTTTVAAPLLGFLMMTMGVANTDVKTQMVVGAGIGVRLIEQMILRYSRGAQAVPAALPAAPAALPAAASAAPRQRRASRWGNLQGPIIHQGFTPYAMTAQSLSADPSFIAARNAAAAAAQLSTQPSARASSTSRKPSRWGPALGGTRRRRRSSRRR